MRDHNQGMLLDSATESAIISGLHGMTMQGIQILPVCARFRGMPVTTKDDASPYIVCLRIIGR